MKLTLVTAAGLAGLLAGCASQTSPCEDVTLASEQIQACHSLQRQIARAKDKPIIRTELERRFQQDCVDMRYYRDGHQEAICGNKEKLEQLTEEAIKNQAQ